MTSATSSTVSTRIGSSSRYSGSEHRLAALPARRARYLPLVMPNWWHDKSKTPEFAKGYIERLWFYNQTLNPHGALSQHRRSAAAQSQCAARHPARPQSRQDAHHPAARDYQRLNSYGSGQGSSPTRISRPVRLIPSWRATTLPRPVSPSPAPTAPCKTARASR